MVKISKKPELPAVDIHFKSIVFNRATAKIAVIKNPIGLPQNL